VVRVGFVCKSLSKQKLLKRFKVLEIIGVTDRNKSQVWLAVWGLAFSCQIIRPWRSGLGLRRVAYRDTSAH
jgi:hypothetical protein